MLVAFLHFNACTSLATSVRTECSLFLAVGICELKAGKDVCPTGLVHDVTVLERLKFAPFSTLNGCELAFIVGATNWTIVTMRNIFGGCCIDNYSLGLSTAIKVIELDLHSELTHLREAIRGFDN